MTELSRAFERAFDEEAEKDAESKQKKELNRPPRDHRGFATK